MARVDKFTAGERAVLRRLERDFALTG